MKNRERNPIEKAIAWVFDLLNIEKKALMGIAAESVLISIWMLAAMVIILIAIWVYKL